MDTRVLPLNRTCMLFCLLSALTAHGLAWQSDNGDGTFSNPPLYADYPDPDIIRVDNDFYFVTTTFANAPALTILRSQDLVNWNIVSHVIPRLEGREQYDLRNGTSYRGGVFAASIRHYKGVFYVVDTPTGQNTRIYYSKNICGPWQCNQLDLPAFDPGFFIDSDGIGYIATSGGWDGHVTLLKLNEDFSKVIDSRGIHYIRGAEGSRIVKRNGWYYLFNAIPGNLSMTVSRARNLYGPWETQDSISDTSGGHQGAIVDLPDGNWFGFAMRDYPGVGRMTNISPIFWENDWPIWGTKEAPNRIPEKAQKPVRGKPVCQPATSDDFSAPKLGLQWQWNHNPDDSRWSLSERQGFLRLKPTQATDFWTARNTLAQKGQGPWSRGTVKLDVSNLSPGDVCGFGTLGKYNGHIMISSDEKGLCHLSMRVIQDAGQDGLKTDTLVSSVPVEGTEIMLRTELDFERDKALCSYSVDGKTWTSLGGEFPAVYDWQFGTFQGPQFAIFCYNPNPGKGYVDVDSFEFSDKK